MIHTTYRYKPYADTHDTNHIYTRTHHIDTHTIDTVMGREVGPKNSTDRPVFNVQPFYCPETESKITGTRQGASRQGVGNGRADRQARSRKQGSRQAGRDSTTGGWSAKREV